MPKPSFEPQPDNSFRIVHPEFCRSFVRILKKIAERSIPTDEAIARLQEILKRYPYHFEAARMLADIHAENGDCLTACDIRYKACQQLMKLLPEEDEEETPAFDWEYRDNQQALLLLEASAIDHFLAGDFEMAAAMLETLLELDEEDHLGALQTLAYCYVALDEPDSFRTIAPDMNGKEAGTALAELWASFRFTGELEPERMKSFEKEWAAVYREFTSGSHEITEAYLSDIDSERPSKEARALLLWLRTEHLWQGDFGDFITALKNR